MRVAEVVPDHPRHNFSPNPKLRVGERDVRTTRVLKVRSGEDLPSLVYVLDSGGTCFLMLVSEVDAEFWWSLSGKWLLRSVICSGDVWSDGRERYEGYDSVWVPLGSLPGWLHSWCYDNLPEWSPPVG